MPTSFYFHSMGGYTEDDLKKSRNETGEEFGVKVLNPFYDLDSGTSFCLLAAPDRYTMEKHHYKFRTKCNWITRVKMTSGYDGSDQVDK
jgi:hypothetical protein